MMRALRAVGRRVETLDACDAALSRQQIREIRFHVEAQGADNSHSGDDNAVFHTILLKNVEAQPSKTRIKKPYGSGSIIIEGDKKPSAAVSEMILPPESAGYF